MTPILPGSTIGVLGSGQLGRMLALAARRMGYRVHSFSPERDTPAGQVSDWEIVAEYGDLDAVKKFAAGVSVVTFEFENVPAATAQAAASVGPLRPGPRVLEVTQHRIREKTFLSKNGFPVTPFEAVNSLDQLRRAVGKLGAPGILKTACFGYDGKGQQYIDSLNAADLAMQHDERAELIYEAFVDFDREVSVVAARGIDKSFASWGVIDNSHRDHILDLSVCPSSLDKSIAKEAVEIARAILEALDVVGVLCVEFFVTQAGKLLVNELAPRPHNSGHLTIEGHMTSQFEQQLRAVCGLPLGDTTQLRPAAMANLLGDIWCNGEPNWPAACAFPGVKLHLYGKASPRPGRKMGHLTGLGDTSSQAAEKALAARESLMKQPPQ
jgi:5-(carboxyamino)imidazole ribonucleotide synthase